MLVTMKQSVNERVKLLRSSLKLTQIEFAQELNISASSIAKVETGERPSRNTIDSICDTYSVSEDWILNGKGELTFERKDTKSAEPWKDEAFQHLKDEVKFYRNLLTQMAGSKQSFLRRVKQTA